MKHRDIESTIHPSNAGSYLRFCRYPDLLKIALLCWSKAPSCAGRLSHQRCSSMLRRLRLLPHVEAEVVEVKSGKATPSIFHALTGPP